ncbi:MAG: hypothetical protein ACREFJ_07450 [Acetobacteraceae bacterium]
MKLPALDLVAGSLLAALSFGSVPAFATVITGTATFADKGSNTNSLTVTGSANDAMITGLDLTPGLPVMLKNCLTMTLTYPAYYFEYEQDNISTKFNFTGPSPGSGTISGTGEVLGR